ncbi:Excinuclease cho, partial [Frankliniella fusca]
HIASYRMLNKLKRSCVQPTRRDNGETSAFAPNHNSTMQMMVEHCPSPILNVDDLRSPLVKKGRRDNSEVLNTSFEMIQLDDNMEELATPLQAEELATPLQAELEDPATYEWPKHVVHTLINELGKRIGEFKFQKKKVTIPLSVYENISKAMKQKGWHYPANILYEKKRGLDSSYCRYKKAGKIHWPFMQGLAHLHSGIWPVGFVSGDALDSSMEENLVENGQGKEKDMEKQVEQIEEFIHANDHDLVQEQHNVENIDQTHQNLGEEILLTMQADQEPPRQDAAGANARSNEKENFEWDVETEDALLKEVFESRQHFAGKKLVRNRDKFAYVASQLVAMGLPVDSGMCQTKFADLHSKFNLEFDRTDNTGESASTWPHFQTFIDYEEGSVACKPIVAVSLGAVSKVKKAEEIVERVRTGCKGRPPNKSREERVHKLAGTASCSSKASPGGAIGYQNRVLNMQERRLQLEEQYLEEFRLYSQEFRQRGVTLREGVQHLREMKKDHLRRVSNEGD